MKLKSLGANQTEIDLGLGLIVFFSYETPVAAFIPGTGYVRTSTKWSSTTTRHINKWLGAVKATEVEQEILNTLMENRNV